MTKKFKIKAIDYHGHPVSNAKVLLILMVDGSFTETHYSANDEALAG